MTTPSILARHMQKRRKKLQDGVVLSFTKVMHPPAGFENRPRTIGLIELQDGSRVLGQILGTPTIGQRVTSRMILSQINPEGLRMYDVAFEPCTAAPVQQNIQKKFPGYILALTGPSGVGKTTVSRMLISMFKNTETVPILTTREKKSGDDGEYCYLSKEKFSEELKRGDIVAFAHLPSSTEERWYGYRKSDIEKIWKKGKLPVVITEMHLLRGLTEHYGRRSLLSFGLLPPGKSKRAMLSALLHRLRLRGRDAEEHIKDRLKNAVNDLQFFSQHADLFDRILVNDDVQVVVETVKKSLPSPVRRG